MNAIVFDLELVKRFRKEQLSEIIEIGACKIQLETGSMLGEFQIYTLPKNGVFSKSTRSFINMSEQDAQQAVPFAEGIRRFAAWLGDDYYLCSWGMDDRVHFISQCVRDHIPLDWLRNYNDIQRPIGKLLTGGGKNQLGLKNALALAGIEPTGKAHRGIDDALNTAELFVKYKDSIELQTNILTEQEAREQYKRLMAARARRLDEAAKRAQGASPSGSRSPARRPHSPGSPAERIGSRLERPEPGNP